MDIGKKLKAAREKLMLSKDQVSEKLKVSAEVISSWEENKVKPTLKQFKDISKVYKIKLEELIDFDQKMKTIQNFIQKTDDSISEKIDWNATWSKKYPIIKTYKEEVDVEKYKNALSIILDELKQEYNYSEVDAVLVLKDMLYEIFKQRKKK